MAQPERPTAQRILVVDDHQGSRLGLCTLLRREGYMVHSAADGFKALGCSEVWAPDAVLTDVRMPGIGGIELIAKLRERRPDVAVVVMTGFASVEGAVQAMQHGADDYLVKPLDLPQVLQVLQRSIASRVRVAEAERLAASQPLGDPADDSRLPDEIVGESKSYRDAMELARQVAGTRLPISIVGEAGTGKQLLARQLHQWTGRTGPFVSASCSGVDPGVFERGLFGPKSSVVAAQDGTLLLADVDEMPLEIQTRVLRLLKTRGYIRDDGEHVDVDVHFIATTRKNLADEVKAGRFREDLYHRLGVVCLPWPSLRERLEDISLLAARFVRRSASRTGKRITGCSARVLEVLTGYAWPGNVTQLADCMERAVIAARGTVIEPRDLPRELFSAQVEDIGLPKIPGASMQELERYAILRTLEHVGGSTSKAAKVLGISSRTIQYRVNEYGQTGRGRRNAPTPEPAPSGIQTAGA